MRPGFHTAIAALIVLGSMALATSGWCAPARVHRADSVEAELARLNQVADWPAMERLSRSELAGAEKRFGVESLRVAGAADWLSHSLEQQGRLGEAEPARRRALAIRTRRLGADHPDTWASTDNLAGLLEAENQFAEAERLRRGALASMEKTKGPDDLATADGVNGLAGVLDDEGRYAEGEALYRRALAIREKARGPEHLETALALNNLAYEMGEQGHYSDAEPLYRRALAIREKVLGPENPDTAVSLNNLAVLLWEVGRHEEAEPLLRRVLSIREKALGPESPETAPSLNNLAALLLVEGRYADAELLQRRALAIFEKAKGPDHPDTATALGNLASLLADVGRFDEAETLHRRALAIDEHAFGPDHPRTGTSLNNLASLLHIEGRDDEAEPLMRRVLAVYEKAFGQEHPATAKGLNNLAILLEGEGRHGEAEALARRALAVREKTLGPEHVDTADSLNNLAVLAEDQGRFEESEPLKRRALAIREKALGPRHPLTAQSLGNLALLLETTGRRGEAEPLYRRALSIDEAALGPEHPAAANDLNNLAASLRDAGRLSDAEPLQRRALAIAEKALGREHRQTTLIRENLAALEALQLKHGDAVRDFRTACGVRSHEAREGAQDEVEPTSRSDLSICSSHLTLALWAWSSNGGGPQTTDRPESLQREAFVAAQRSALSAAGDALARSAALRAAKAAGVGEQAQDYERALSERDALDQAFADAAAATGEAGAAKRAALSRSRLDTVAAVERLASELKVRAPRYWDYRAPDAVGVAALQAKAGPDAALLHDKEALILFLTPKGKDKGLVFAVSKDRLAWAQIPLTGDELRTRVEWLRAQIASDRERPFDRQAAYELYQALLGDPGVASVVASRSELLFVPSGPLTGLPPGLLVTRRPSGGQAGDADPSTMRHTPWLLRAKSVAVLPTVSSLRTLRQLLPTDRAAARDPVLAFVDPDFGPPSNPHEPYGSRGVRGLQTYFKDGRPSREALGALPRLPGTRQEGEALVKALQGAPDSLLAGSDASKAQLLARNADGRLAQVRVLEFATHGLVAGDVVGLGEPALVLAAGPRPEDELLLASEAATLKLNAEWVLLSACNTASSDAPEAQGLSGLSRAFFFAGGRSLLVSHWRVRDDVAARLVPDVLITLQRHPTLTRAEALRRASLAILDAPGLNASSPSAWASFTLIGEAGP